jgi:hypothetical protein
MPGPMTDIFLMVGLFILFLLLFLLSPLDWYKIPNNKHPARKMAGRQITNKSQIPMLNDQKVWRYRKKPQSLHSGGSRSPEAIGLKKEPCKTPKRLLFLIGTADNT